MSENDPYYPSSEAVEEYLGRIEWTKDTDDYVKTLVAGNIRAFSAWLRERETGNAKYRVMCEITRAANLRNGL